MQSQAELPSKKPASAKPSFLPPQSQLLQRIIGNRAMTQMSETHAKDRDVGLKSATSSNFGLDFSRIPIHPPAPGGIQPKLAINKPGDEYEQEADRIADRVTATPAHTNVSNVPPRIQRLTGQTVGPADAAPASVGHALASSGNALEPALREDMEQRFGHDFSRVRVHWGADAEQSAWDVNATAYTLGHEIVFGAGQFAPGTPDGRRLIAHELTHVVQQTGWDGITSPLLQRQPAPAPTRQEKFPWIGRIHGTWSAALRKEAKHGSTIADLPRDTFVTVIGRKGGWLHVQATTAEGKEVEGYVSQELVAFNRYDVESGPTIEEVLRLDQTVSIKGLAADQPNYADRAIRAIVSAPIGPDYILIPHTDATGQNGISIPKGDFHIDEDPLSGFAIGNNQVYRSRVVAEAVVADLNKLTPGVPQYVYYLRDGIIFPTILSDTTLPILMPNIRHKRDQDLRDIKATADLAEELLWWYVTARFPIKVGPGTGVGRLSVARGRTLSAEELEIAEMLVREGRNVRALKEATRTGARTADFIVDAVRTELKTIKNLTSKDISGALGRRILEGAGQGRHVIADVRQQAGMTRELAERAVRRAFGADTAARIQKIRVIGKGFDFTVPRLPQ